MNLQQLRGHALAGEVDELNLISIEGGIYVLEVQMDGIAYGFTDASGKSQHMRSIEHARDVLHELPRLPFNLVHAVVHDEMCGMPDGPQDTLRVPISMNSQW